MSAAVRRTILSERLSRMMSQRSFKVRREAAWVRTAEMPRARSMFSLKTKIRMMARKMGQMLQKTRTTSRTFLRGAVSGGR